MWEQTKIQIYTWIMFQYRGGGEKVSYTVPQLRFTIILTKFEVIFELLPKCRIIKYAMWVKLENQIPKQS